MAVQQDQFDFEGDDYARNSEYRPYAQMINPKFDPRLKGLAPYGIAVTKEQAERAKFSVNEDTWIYTKHKFSTTESEVFVTTRPRIVLIRRSPLGVKSRESGRVLPEKTYEDYKADKLNYKIFSKYLIILVDKDCRPLHDPTQPLQMTLNGAAGAAFGQMYRKTNQGNLVGGFQFDLETAYAQYKKKGQRAAMGNLFHAYGVYCPHLEPEEKGSGANTSMVATTIDYDKPTVETLEKFLIPPVSDLGKWIKEIYDSNPDFGVLKPKDEATSFTGEPPMDYDDFDPELGVVLPTGYDNDQYLNPQRKRSSVVHGGYESTDDIPY